MNSIVYTDDAVADLSAVFAWYEDQRTGLGREFLEEIGSAEEAIQRAPEGFRALHRDTRRYLLRRFPYQLLYRFMDDRIVEIDQPFARSRLTSRQACSRYDGPPLDIP